MATLTKPQRAERARILRELLLRPAMQRRENPTPDYISAVEDLTDDLVVTETNGGVLTINVTDMMERTDDHRHDTIAASRLVMGHLETAAGRASTRAHLSAGLAHRGFPANAVSDALTWLTEQNLITVSAGTVTDITGDRRPKAPRPALPADLVTPRNSGTAPSTTGTTANRPNMSVDERMVGTTADPMAMGARMRTQATMPSASFEVGEVPTSNKTTVKKTPVAIPDSVLVAYTASVMDMWARHGKPTATWAEFPWDLPTVELPEGVTADDVANHVFYNKLVANGTVRKDGEIFTYVPAERAVQSLTTWIAGIAPTQTNDDIVYAESLAALDSVAPVIPDGWDATALVKMALDAVVERGELVEVDGGYKRTGWDEPVPEVVESKPKTEQKPAGDTSSPAVDPKPEGTATVAKTEEKVVEKTSEPEAPSTKAPAAPVNAPALEKKVDTLTTKVDGIAARLGTLPPPPSKTATIIAAAREADIDVVVCLEDVLVALYVHDEAPRSVIRDRLPGRVRSKSTGRIRDRRSKLGAALALGTRAGVIAIDDDGKKYRYITHADVLDKHAWKARLDRRLGTAA